MARKRVEKELNAADLKLVRKSLRDERTKLALEDDLVPAVYVNRMTVLNLRIDALDKAIWHLENGDK